MRSLQSFTDPEYTDPESAWGWFAVVSWSAALLALGVALVVLAREVGGRATVGLAYVAAAGAVAAAVGNVVEDGLEGARAGDWLYLPGVVLLPLGLVALTVAVALQERGRSRLLALVPACTLVGMFLLERGGGLLVLAVWLIVALRFTRTYVHATAHTASHRPDSRRVPPTMRHTHTSAMQ